MWNIILTIGALAAFVTVILSIIQANKKKKSLSEAGILIIANEVLNGDTNDKNSSIITSWLAAQHIPVKTIRVIRDDKKEIIKALHQLKKQVSIIITTGGLGNTHDDITSESIAKALNKPLLIHQETVEFLKQKLKVDTLTPLQKKLAYLPYKAIPIHNPISFAPGFIIDQIYAFPGFPDLVEAMLPYAEHYLKHHQPIHSAVILSPHKEALLAEALYNIQNQYKDITIGIYSNTDTNRKKHRCRITLHSHNTSSIEPCKKDIERIIKLATESLRD
jgi:molybdenum cofactor synthesis domain-containing protein